MVHFSRPYMTAGKTIPLTRQTSVCKVMSLVFIMLSTLPVAFLPRSKCFLLSWLKSTSAVILEPKKIKSVTVSIVSPSICHELMGLDAMILVFWILSLKPTFSLLSFSFIKRLFSSFLLSAIRVESSLYLRLLIFLPAVLIPVCASSSLTFHMMKSESKSHSVLTNSLWPYGLYNPWNSLGQNSRVGIHSLLQGIFPTQGSNWGLLHDVLCI